MSEYIFVTNIFEYIHHTLMMMVESVIHDHPSAISFFRVHMILQDIVFRYDILEKIAMFGQIYEDWFGSKVPTLNPSTISFFRVHTILHDI